MVSHDVREIGAIADYSYLLSEGEVVAEGTPAELNAERKDVVRQFMSGAPDGPVPFHYPAPRLLRAVARTSGRMRTARARGRPAAPLAGRRWMHCAKLGAVSLFLLRLLGQCVPAWRGRWLVVQQIYNAGARSLVIIMLSGLFVGMVLGLQGYDLLQRFGSESALGVAAALGLIKELGPVLTALLFAGRAGTALCSEIGLMAATDQLAAMEMMAVDPVRHVVAPRFLGGIHRDAAAGGDLQLHRHLWRAAGRRDHDGHPARHLLVTDAERGASCTMSTKG